MAIDWNRVARFYDAYASFTFDIPFFVQEAAAAPAGVLDLMSGTGRVALPLLKAGASVTCVDSSPAMLARLREKLGRERLSAEIVEMRVQDLSLSRQYSLIILPSHSFAELISAQDRDEALRRIYAHLDRDGQCICTLHNPAVRLRTVDGQLRLLGAYPMIEESRELLVWSSATQEAEDSVVQTFQFYEEYDLGGVLLRRTMLPLRFALIGRKAFEAAAASVGFTVLALYGDYDRSGFAEQSSPYMIWVLGR
jgi:ubiquinone/menaquinone biosynthesis C-methylase UbiE